MATATTVTQLIRTYNLQNVNIVNTKKDDYTGKIPQTTNRDKPLYTSLLGTPVVADITFKGTTYVNNLGKKITFSDVTLITVLLNVSRPKNIVKTVIEGRDGTIKEYIGNDDWQISINGIINGDNGHYPTDEVRALQNVIDASIQIEVVSRYLQNIGIYNIVITDHSFDQEAGGYSKQNFTINCISDAVVTAQLI